jgi:hypothetical protein
VLLRRNGPKEYFLQPVWLLRNNRCEIHLLAFSLQGDLFIFHIPRVETHKRYGNARRFDGRVVLSRMDRLIVARYEVPKARSALQFGHFQSGARSGQNSLAQGLPWASQK